MADTDGPVRDGGTHGNESRGRAGGFDGQESRRYVLWILFGACGVVLMVSCLVLLVTSCIVDKPRCQDIPTYNAIHGTLLLATLCFMAAHLALTGLGVGPMLSSGFLSLSLWIGVSHVCKASCQ